MSRYGLVGGITRELLTHQGRAILHDDKAELEFLFPFAQVTKVTDGDLGQPWMWLRDHPDMAAVRFPLRREDFRA